MAVWRGALSLRHACCTGPSCASPRAVVNRAACAHLTCPGSTGAVVHSPTPSTAPRLPRKRAATWITPRFRGDFRDLAPRSRLARVRLPDDLTNSRSAIQYGYAQHCTASHLETVCRKVGVPGADAAGKASRPHDSERYVAHTTTASGMVCVKACLRPDEGALLLQVRKRPASIRSPSAARCQTTRSTRRSTHRSVGRNVSQNILAPRASRIWATLGPRSVWLSRGDAG